MDDLTMLRSLGEELEHEPPATLVRQRQRLTAGDKPTRRRARVRWRLATAGALITAVGTGVALVQTMGIGDQSPPSREPVPVSAIELLDRASTAAAKEPAPRPDQFILIRSKTTGNTWSDEKDRWTGQQRLIERLDWYSVDGSRGQFAREKATDGRPPLGGRVPGKPGWSQGWLCDSQTLPAPSDPSRQPPGCKGEPGYVTDLPTDPAAMLRHLDKIRRDGNANNRWEAAEGLLFEGRIAPKSRVALFQAMKRIKGVTYVKDSVNADGKHGPGLAFDIEDHMRDELVFDPRTYEYIGGGSVLTKDEGGLPAGTRTEAESVEMDVVDKVGQLPKKD